MLSLAPGRSGFGMGRGCPSWIFAAPARPFRFDASTATFGVVGMGSASSLPAGYLFPLNFGAGMSLRPRWGGRNLGYLAPPF